MPLILFHSHSPLHSTICPAISPVYQKVLHLDRRYNNSRAFAGKELLTMQRPTKSTAPNVSTDFGGDLKSRVYGLIGWQELRMPNLFIPRDTTNDLRVCQWNGKSLYDVLQSRAH